MAGRRYYLPPHDWRPGLVELTGDEAHHCRVVMRQAIGDEIILFDGAGREAQARVEELSKLAVRLAPLSERRAAPRAVRLVLGQALLKTKAMETAVEKATELGVSRIVPLLTERCVAKDSARTAKWRRLALEACKQCGNPWAPEIADPTPLKRFLADERSPLQLQASLAEDALPWARLPVPHGCREASVLIGPEGDFTPAERVMMSERGWLPWAFATPILRADTAAVHALSVLAHELSR